MGIPARTRRHRKRAKAAGLRIFRGRLGLDGTVIAGDRRISEVVYGYRFPSYPGRIKIGYSSRGLERVVEQSTAFPETPEVVFVIHDSRARDIEKAFHIALAGQQADVMGSEWFDASWRDLLRVSPVLRKASGHRRWREVLRWIATAVLATGAAALYPFWVMLFTAIDPDAPTTLWRAVSAYVDGMRLLLDNGDPRYLGDLLQWAADVDPHWSLRVAPAAMTAAICTAPWIRWRRQV